MEKTLRAVSVILSLFSILITLSYQTAGAELPEAKSTEVVKHLGNLPAFFMENQGQVAEEARYYFKGSDTVYFTGEAVVFQKTGARGSMESSDRVAGQSIDTVNVGNPPSFGRGLQRQSLAYKLEFVGANATSPQARNELEGKVNYFIGNDSSKWHTNVPTYQEIVYPGLYGDMESSDHVAGKSIDTVNGLHNRIDLVYKGVSGGMKYEFVVHPGASPDDIKLAYTGIEGLSIDEKGNLIIRTALGDMKDEKPYTYQEIGGRKVEVIAEFRLISSPSPSLPPTPYSLPPSSYGFEVAPYDENYPLVIDPGLSYSTFLGGSVDEPSYGIAVDASGNAYVTGRTGSSNFPTTAGAFDTSYNGGTLDAFVTKLNPTGSALVYSTFLGGSSTDWGGGIAVDASGNAYVTGITSSSNFPTTLGAFDTSYNGGTWDAFVTQLNPTGSALVYSTFLGGSSDDFGSGIALDASGNAYVTGRTVSSNFPTTPGAFDTSYNGGSDAFVTQLNPTGSALVYSTFLGGSNWDDSTDIALDASGNAYVTGQTVSSNFPTTLGAFDTSYNGGISDAFVTQLNPAGSGLVYSTFLGGGSGVDMGYGIALDASGNAYVTGYTESSSFPTTIGAFDTSHNGAQDAFVTKLNPAGSALSYSTFLGGSVGESGYGIALDASGNAYVTGNTSSSNFPTTAGAFDTSHNGGLDVFVTQLNPSGSALSYSTFLGGTGSTDWGYNIALDASGNAYVTGQTDSSNFPTTLGAFDTSYNGSQDAFVTKLSLGNQSPVANAGPDQTVHVGASVTLDGSGSSDPDGNTPLSFAWGIILKPLGSTAALSDPTVIMPSFTPDILGDYTIQLVVTDSLGAASAPDTVVISTANSAPVADAGPDQLVIVIGTTVQLDGNLSYDPDGDNITYSWSLIQKPQGSVATLSNPAIANPTFVADYQGDYVASLVVTDSFGAVSAPDTVTVSFTNVKPVANAGGNQAVAVGQAVSLSGSGSTDANGDTLSYNWSLVSRPAGSLAELANLTDVNTSFIADMPGIYVVSLVVNDGLVDSDPASVTITATSAANEVVQKLGEAINAINALDPSAFKNPKMRHALTNKINAVLDKVNQGLYREAINKLQHDVLAKIDGCARDDDHGKKAKKKKQTGTPDKNDWIRDCASQSQVYPLILQAIQLLRAML